MIRNTKPNIPPVKSGIGFTPLICASPFDPFNPFSIPISLILLALRGHLAESTQTGSLRYLVMAPSDAEATIAAYLANTPDL